MSVPQTQFTVLEARNCPYYEVGDKLELAGNALSPPAGRPACIFLVRVVMEMVISDLDSEASGAHPVPRSEYNCPGCTGLIRFGRAQENRYQTRQMRVLAAAERREQAQRMAPLVSLLRSFSFFQALEEDSLKDIIACLTMKKCSADDVILQRGHVGKNLYIVVSGRVAVLDPNGISIAFLGRGEIFGEMSLFSGRPVSATVTAVEPVKLLVMSGRDLRQVLTKYPFLQMVFTRLLIQRISEINASRSLELAAGMSGRLLELPAAELFQMLHENSKTGHFEMDLPGGPASVVFLDGEILNASYRERNGVEAFFDILRERDGRFRFLPSLPLEAATSQPLDGFMKLLMEGLRRIDEENAAAAIH